MADLLDGLVSRLRFRHLRMLVELQRWGSIGKAAASLHLTQPALSKMLKEVEDAFGLTIYSRGPRGLQATTQGQAVLQGAAVLLAELGHMHDCALASMQKVTAVLHLGVPPAVAAGTLPLVLARLHADGAAVLVRLREEPVPVLFDALVAGELDALLTSFNPVALAATRSARLVYERCLDHTYAVIAQADHRLARRRTVTWQELLHESWILPEPALLARQGLEAHFLAAGVAVPEAAITSSNPATNVQLVAAGLGVAAVPAFMAVAEERIGRVVRLRVPLDERRVQTALVYRAGSVTHPLLRQLRKAVVATREAGPSAGARARRARGGG
jgi:LysR family transcriptional regulator of abg operon